MKTIHVSASKEYDVIIESGLLDRLGEYAKRLLPGKTACIVSDSNVAPLYLRRTVNALESAGFTAESFVFPAGEESKNGETWLRLLNFLAEKKLTRADALIALGGGVTGDLTGFAAATFLRGVHCIQIPTTLLACVDSSVGGKTAIDLPAGKNLAGAFYQPDLVLCDPDLLKTLPDAVLGEGCAEVIKYGMIGDAAFLRELLDRDIRADLENVIARCVEMKRGIVEMDEFDTGERQKLNFGHTFGHGVEAASSFAIAHGAAVAIGMGIISRAAVKKGFCPQSAPDMLEKLCAKYQLDLSVPFAPETICQYALGDKKRSGTAVSLIVPTGVGICAIRRVPVNELIDWAKAGMA